MKKSTEKHNNYDNFSSKHILLYIQTFKLRYKIFIFRLYSSKRYPCLELFIHKVCQQNTIMETKAGFDHNLIFS